MSMMWTFLKIGLFTIGGGYAMIPLIAHELISKQWMTAGEVTDVIALAKMTPGPFAVNAATFAGMKILGIGGAIACTAGVLLPSLLITIIVAKFFFNFKDSKIVKGILTGVCPAVVALIASAIVTVAMLTLFRADSSSNILTAIKSVNIWSIVILVISLVLLLWKKLHPIYVIMIAGALGIIFHYVVPIYV